VGQRDIRGCRSQRRVVPPRPALPWDKRGTRGTDAIKHPFSTRRGRKLRDAKLRSVNYLCERCRTLGKVVVAVTVHHVHALEDGGDPFPPLEGLEALCEDHHKQTHGSKPKAGVDPATGLPTSPDHWWCQQEQQK
jgi:5-methylcytosine-specific restriction enzyme A